MTSPTRPRLLRFVSALLAAAVLAACAAPPVARPQRPPNVLLVIADDLGYADLGVHGSTDVATPALDALAAEGVRFTDAYASSVQCSPSRAGLLTGRYQNRFGHEFNPASPEQGLPLSETTLAERLRAAGYATGLVGKWHLGATPELHPRRRGYDEFFGFLGGAHRYRDGDALLRDAEPTTEPTYLTEAFGREAVAFIGRHRDRPWFLTLSFNAVHAPLEGTPETLARFAGIADPRRRTYAAALLAMDQALARVRAELRAQGLERDTLVVFVNDNGGPTLPGITLTGARNEPLRGSKRTTLEGGIRVPMLLAWPGRLAPGVYRQPVIQMDLHASILAAAGLAVPADLDGVDLWPHLRGADARPPHAALYWRYGRQMAIREGDWKLLRYDVAADDGGGVLDAAVTAPRLYDLSRDPGETNDLAAAEPARVAALLARWQAWNATLAPPRWGEGAPGHH